MSSQDQYRDQTIGSVSSFVNQERVRELNEKLFQIAQQQQSQVAGQQDAFLRSMEEVQKVRDLMANDSHNFLGSELTKHGEIAEHLEVNIRNARSILEQNPPEASFGEFNRIAPSDYLIAGEEVQSKFIQGTHKGLSHILDHMEKYPGYGKDGSCYIIPRDQHDILQKIVNGQDVDGLHSRTVRAALDKIKQIENETGKNFSDVVKPSISRYDQVQEGVVYRTIDGHESQLAQRNEELQQGIKEQAKAQQQQAHDVHQPSLGEAAKIGGIGALIGSGFGVGFCVYQKHKEGKKLTNYDIDDWKDIGVEFAKGGLKGGITGVAVYGMTNYAGMAAPIASAFVSTTFGVASLANSYAKGEIDLDEFVEQGQVLCFDSAAVALGATVGQALIPIPIVGTLIGTFATKTLFDIYKNTLHKESAEIQKRLDEEYQAILAQVDRQYQAAVFAIMEEYERIGRLTQMAFDFERNACFRFKASIELALKYGVDESKILKTIDDVDDFMLS